MSLALSKINDLRMRLGNAIAGLESKPMVDLSPPKNTPTAIEILTILNKHVGKEFEHTPDWFHLEKNAYTAVFLYCNMLKGGSRHSVIENIYRIKDDDGLCATPYAFTKDRFAVWQTRDGKLSTPVALVTAPHIPQLASPLRPELPYLSLSGKLKGKLFIVRSDEMKRLDNEKQNGVLYNRIKIKIQIPYRLQIKDPIDGLESYTTGHRLTDEAVTTVKVWAYIGNTEYWGNVPMHSLERCAAIDPNRPRQRKKNTSVYIHPPKKWMNEPYYMFNHWEVAHK